MEIVVGEGADPEGYGLGGNSGVNVEGGISILK